MIVVVWVFGLITATAGTLAWAWESLLIERPTVHDRIFSTPASDIPAIRLWTFGLGFYNLFLAVGLVVGLVLWASGAETAGRTLVLYITAFIALCGLVLFIDDRLGYGRVRGAHIGGALGQGVPPLIAFVAALLA